MEQNDKKDIVFDEKDYAQHEKMKDEAKPILMKIKKARDFVSSRDTQLEENMAFYQGNQFLLSQYSDERPWVIQMNTPYASMAIDTRVASLSANDYIGQLQPLALEDAETIKSLQYVLEDEWERANVDRVIDNAVRNAAVVRESYAHIIFDTDKKYGDKPGEICAYLLDTMAVLLDPRARKFSDCRYIIVAERLPVEEAEENYPEYAKFFPRSSSYTPEDRGEKFIDNDYQTEQSDILTSFIMYEKKNKKIVKSVIIEDMLVEEKILKGLSTFPIAQLCWKKAAQSAYGLSLMDDILSLQKAISAIESAITNTAVSYSSPAVIVRKGSGINPAVVAKTIGAPGVVYVSDIPISEAMQPVVPAKIDDKIVTLKQEFENAIDKIAGVTNQFVGQIGTAGNTAGGTEMAIERAKIIETAVLENIGEFVETMTIIFIEYITSAYSGETFMSRKRSPSSPNKFEFSSTDIPKGADKVKFSYFIDLSTKTQYSKERERNNLLQMYQMDNQYEAEIKLINQLDILHTYDLRNMEELEDRYKMLSQQTIEMKTQTVMNITTAATQYAIPPELTQAAVTEVIKGGKVTPALDQFMAAAQQMAGDMQGAMQQADQDLTGQGIQQEFIDKAKGIMQSKGQTATPEELDL